MIVALLNARDALVYRLRHGHWCRHERIGPWRIHDTGRFKARRCPDCQRWERS